MLLGLLPLAVLLLIVGANTRRRALVDAIVPSACAWALTGAMSLEGLSLLGAIGRPALTILWLIAAMIAAVLILLRQRQAPAASPTVLRSDFCSAALAIGSGAIVGVTFIVALLSTPNNYDSMSYHLPRIEEWIQQRSLAFFPTPFTSQLKQAPLAEMLILHFRLLAGSDRFDNLVQWLAFAGCVSIAPLVARRLGAGVAGCVLAAVFVATLPMAILQSSSTQTDLVTAFFLIAAAERLLAWEVSRGIADGLGVGVTVGLAILAKGTAFFYALPIGLCVALVLLRDCRWRDIGVGAAMIAVIVCLNAGQWQRNFAQFATPLGPHSLEINQDHSPSAIVSNLLRDTVMNFVTPSKRLNDALVDAVDRIDGLIGADPSDPETTFPGHPFADLPRNVSNGDTAPNPLHVLAIGLMLALLGWHALSRRRTAATPLPQQVRVYLAAVLLGGFLSCALLRWQLWINRLELPFFVLMAPAAATVLAARMGRRMLIAGGAGLSIAAMPFVVFNQERPIFGDPVRWLNDKAAVAPNILSAGPYEMIFWLYPRRYDAYREAVARLAGRTGNGVGLMFGERGGVEYPLWRMLKNSPSSAEVRIEHVCLSNSDDSSPSTLRPDVMLATDHVQPDRIVCSNGTFIKEASYPTGAPEANSEISVYRRIP